MENSRNTSNCEAFGSIVKGSRKKNASNLSLRLQPDFDVKKYLTQNPVRETSSGRNPAIPVSPKNLSRNFEISNTEFYRAVEILSPKCITDSLQKILNFLQSDSKELCFPNIINDYERFLVQIASDNMYLACSSFNIESQDLARKILRVVEQNRNVFKWIHSYENGLVTKNLLVYKKIYLGDGQKKKTADKLPSTPLNSSLISDSSVESGSLCNLTKAQRDFVRKKRLIERLPAHFINSSLRAVLSFMEDPLKASLEFTDIGSKESRFLQCVTTIARKTEYHQLFPENCIEFLKSIAKFKRDNWKLELSVGKLNKNTRLRKLSFCKVPADEKGPDRQQINKQCGPDKGVEIGNVLKPTAVVTKVPVRRAVSTDRSVPDKGVEIRNVLKPTAVATKVPARRTVSTDRRNRPITGISFQSAGNIDYMEEDKDLPTIQCTRKSKLLVAMSTPMESEKAERMMIKMGWKGGALGARGDGITEPIIPPLHLSKGAGLGHVKAVTRSATEFRTNFLKNVLVVLDCNRTDTYVVPYSTALTKNEMRFINGSVYAFNSRKAMGVTLDDEVQLMNRVLERMASDPCLQIVCSVSGDKKELKMRVCKTTTHKPKKTEKKPTKSITPPNNIENNLSNRINELIATFELENLCPTAKSAKSLAYRIIFLENIKEFLQLPDEEKEYSIDCVLTKKQQSYIQSVVLNINKKHRGRLSCEIENDILMDIQRVAGDCYMMVLFDKHKFKLHKRYYQKRATNSAVLAPPVSTDLKNTIIYRNNIATTKNQSVTRSENHKATSSGDQNVASDDDDVILIEEKREIIVISDSDSVNSKIMDDTKSDKIDCDVSKDISNESLLLEILERENNISTIDYKLERYEDVSESQPANVEADSFNLLNVKDETIEKLNDLNINFSDGIPISVTEPSSKDSTLDDSFNLEDEIVKLENALNLEVNNNIDLVKNLNDTDVLKNDENTASVKDLSQNSGKRSRSQSSDYDPFIKIRKCDKIKKIFIAPKNYPKENITRESVQKFQLIVSDFIEESTILPILECHGVKDGALYYSCHNEKTLLWLKNLTSVANLDLKIFDSTDYCGEKKYVVKFKINSFIRDEVKTLIDRLELYNTGLDTRDWRVVNEQVCDDYTVITVKIDEESLKFISENDFSMFLGVDKAQFSIVFD